MIDVEELTRLCGGEEEARGVYELERVPLRGVVARGDCQPAARAATTHEQLHGRDGADVEVNDAAARREKAGDDRLPDHLAGGARVAPDDDCAGAHVSPERLREARQKRRRQRLADDAAHAADADLECGYGSHW